MSHVRLASISEFGAFDGETGRVRDDLRAWSRRREVGGLKSTPYYAYTMGSADLIEVTVFDDHRHLSEMGASSVQAFQRSVGTLCPSQALLPALGEDVPVKLRSIAALGEDVGEPPPPLVAFTYLKLGPLAALFVEDAIGDSEGGPLDRALTPFGPGQQLWRDYQSMVTLNGVANEPAIQVVPLVGIDTVEWVVVTRCHRVEQVGCLAWCLRQSKLADWWPAHVSRPRRELLARMLRTSEEEVAGQWARTPAFAGTTTVLGFDEYWARRPLETTDDAAAEGLLTQRRTFVPGAFGRAWSPSDGSNHCWMLFDRADLLLPGADGARADVARGTAGGNEPVHLAQFSGPVALAALHAAVCGGPSSPRRDSARTTLSRTELAVRLRLPDAEVTEEATACSLLDGFHGTLRDLRHSHLRRTGEEESQGAAVGERGARWSRPTWLDEDHGWTRRWLAAARTAGLVYPLTGGVVNLMGTVTEYLAEDFEGFADLLPGLELLVERAERLAADMSKHGGRGPIGVAERPIQALRFEYGALERMATARGRRDHPLRPPKATLSFEGRAGYRVARDGFVAFVDAIRQAFVFDRPIFVHDTVRGETSAEFMGRGSTSVQISPMVLVHPVHWCYGHEIAHLFLVDGRSFGRRAGGEALAGALEEAGIDFEQEGDVESAVPSYARLVDGMRRCAHRYLESGSAEVGAQVSGDLFVALHVCFEELFADMLQWALVGPGERAERAERLFFVLGPSLIHGTRGWTGAAVPSHATLMQLVLRCCLLSVLAAGVPVDEAMLDTVLNVLNAHAGEDDTLVAGDARELADAVDMRLQALRVDLDVPGDIWDEVITALRSDLASLRESKAPSVALLVKPLVAYFELIRDIAGRIAAYVHVQWQDAPLRPLRLFDEYIGSLMDLAPEARPWPLHVEGHVFARPSGDEGLADPRGEARLALSRRGGVIVRDDAEDDPAFRSRYTLDKLQFLLRLEECARVRRRGQVLVYSQVPSEEAS